MQATQKINQGKPKNSSSELTPEMLGLPPIRQNSDPKYYVFTYSCSINNKHRHAMMVATHPNTYTKTNIIHATTNIEVRKGDYAMVSSGVRGQKPLFIKIEDVLTQHCRKTTTAYWYQSFSYIKISQADFLTAEIDARP